jgi:hypothetical protein
LTDAHGFLSGPNILPGTEGPDHQVFLTIGSRYDKSDVHFGGGVHPFVIIDWLKFGV